MAPQARQNNRNPGADGPSYPLLVLNLLSRDATAGITRPVLRGGELVHIYPPMERSMVDDAIPELRLAHAQALWILARLGFRSGGSFLTFHGYVKSVRRYGVPFSPEELVGGRPNNYEYRYEHLIELAVALSFRLHRVLPWDVVNVLVKHRLELRSIYRRAYVERETGAGQPICVTISGGERFYAKGLFLDLNFSYVDDRLVSVSGPRALTPAEALHAYLSQRPGSQIRPPIALSEIASELIELTRDIPGVREITKTWSLLV
jgi:hypothetical protein